MGYYDHPENVNEYIKMSREADGTWIIDQLKEHLPNGASLLELGIGPGKDLDMLKENYQVTGSDYAKPFINLYKVHKYSFKLSDEMKYHFGLYTLVSAR